jgi:hypothetical protein
VTELSLPEARKLIAEASEHFLLEIGEMPICLQGHRESVLTMFRAMIVRGVNWVSDPVAISLFIGFSEAAASEGNDATKAWAQDVFMTGLERSNTLREDAGIGPLVYWSLGDRAVSQLTAA